MTPVCYLYWHAFVAVAVAAGAHQIINEFRVFIYHRGSDNLEGGLGLLLPIIIEVDRLAIFLVINLCSTILCTWYKNIAIQLALE